MRQPHTEEVEKGDGRSFARTILSVKKDEYPKRAFQRSIAAHPQAHLYFRLREQALAEGVDLEFREKKGLAHLFQFAPIPEVRPVIDRYIERLKYAALSPY